MEQTLEFGRYEGDDAALSLGLRICDYDMSDIIWSSSATECDNDLEKHKLIIVEQAEELEASPPSSSPNLVRESTDAPHLSRRTAFHGGE